MLQCSQQMTHAEAVVSFGQASLLGTSLLLHLLVLPDADVLLQVSDLMLKIYTEVGWNILDKNMYMCILLGHHRLTVYINDDICTDFQKFDIFCSICADEIMYLAF